MKEAMKVRKYRVDLNGRTFHQRLELHKSEAFKYGNGTCVAYYDGLNSEPEVYDTRYEIGIVDGFDEWADDFLKGILNPKCEVTVE